MAVTTGSWLFDTNTKTATYKETADGATLFTISGFGSSITQDTFDTSGNVTVDANGNVKLGTALLEGLADNGTLSMLGGGIDYKLALANGISQKPTLSSAPSVSTADSSGNATITYTIPEYYTVEGDMQITYHAAESVTLGTINGLKSDANVTADNSGNIKIKETNLEANQNVSLTPTYADDLYNSSGNLINLSEFLKFQLVDSNNAAVSSNTFGFGTGSDAWDTTNSGQTKTATYRHITPEGWTLDSSGQNITYKEETYKTIVTIDGFKSNVTITNEGSPSTQHVTVESTAVVEIDTATSSTVKFKIKTSALGDNDLTLTTGEGAVSGTTYTLALADDTGSANSNNDVTEGDNRVGFSNENATSKYWAVSSDTGATTKTATYQYDVGKGWELNTAADKIVYKQAEPNKVLATITGLSASTQTSGNSATISGITVTEPTTSGEPATTTPPGTIKLAASVFPTNDNSKVELTADNYNLELSDTNLKTTLTAADTPSVAIANSISAGNATVTAATKAYYEPGDSSSNKSYTYHTAKNDTPFATITGLADNAATSDFTIDDSTKTITLSDGALGNNDITFTRISGTTIADLEENSTKYHFAIDITDATKKATEDNQVDPNATKTIEFDGSGNADVKSNTLDWYNVTTTAEDSGAVAAGERIKFTAGKQGETIATITGLKSGTASSSVVHFTEDNDHKQTGTIVLGQDALPTGDNATSIVLNANTSTYGGLDALNLKLAFDESIVNATGTANEGKVGFQDSGNYWTVGTASNNISAGTVAYQHHTQEGWTLIANDTAVMHTNATAAKNILTISGLKESGITPTQNTTTGLNEIDGITVTADKKILLDEKLFKIDTSATPSGSVQIASGGAGYTLALANDTGNLTDGDGTAANDNKVGFKEDINNAYWRIDTTTGTAYYQYDTSEGWTYNTTTKKIEYTAEKTGENATVLAKITGLNKNVLAGVSGKEHKAATNQTVDNCYEEVTGLSVGADGTITLSDTVLDTTVASGATEGVTVTLTDNADKLATDKGISYKLALAAGVSNVTGVEAGIGFNITLTDVAAVTTAGSEAPATKKATIIRTRKAGWEFADSNNLSMTYKAEVNDTLATITGLNKDIKVSATDETAQQASATSGNKNVNPTHLYIANGSGNYTPVIELDGKSVKLSNAALAQKNTALERGTITGNIKTADEVAYSLVLAEPNTGSTTKVGFENEDAAEKYWHVDNTTKTTAHYQYDVGEGWTLAANGLGITYDKAKRELTADEKDSSSDAAKAAAYSVTTPTVLATITNLRAADSSASPAVAALTDAELNSGITVTKDDKNFNIVTIDKSILNTGSSATTIDKTDYKLALKGDGDAPDVKDGKIGFENTDYATATKYWTIENGTGNNEGTVTATYKYDYKEGWTVNSSGQIVYTAGGTKTLATISGLASDVVGTTVLGESAKYATLNGISVDGNTFKLKESVLNTKTDTAVNITIANGSDAPVGTTYKLAFDGGTQTVKDDGTTTLGFEEKSRDWTIGDGSNTGSATYKYTNKQGWTLNEAGTSISYTQQTTHDLVTLKGLKTDNLAANIGTAITVSGGIPTSTSLGTITINNTSVLDTSADNNALEIDTKVDNGNSNYKLVYDGIVGKKTDPKDDMQPTTALNFDNAAGGTVKLKKTLAGGWYLDESTSGASKKLTYKAKVDDTLATVSGLDSDASASNVTYNESNKTITVGKDALTNTGVTIDMGKDGNIDVEKNTYKLAFDSTETITETGSFNGKVGFDNYNGATKYWATDGAGTVTYQYNVGAGWTLTDGTDGSTNSSIAYVKPQQPTPENADPNNYSAPAVSAKITGLKSGLTANNGSISGITLGADGTTITVDKSVLGTNAGTPAQLDTTSGISSGYSLALKDADASGKVGFADSSAYWKIVADNSNTGKYKAIYQYDTDEGWTINDGVITYTAAAVKPIVTITGLTGLTATDADEKPATIDGITLDTATDTFKLSNDLLGNVDISLNNSTSGLNDTYKGKTYSLGLANDTGSANDNNDVTAGDDKVGFVPKDNKWVRDGSTNTTYYYKHEIGEGWTLTDSNNDSKYDKITYTGASDDTSYSGNKSSTITLATVTNLKADLQPDSYGYIDGIDVSEDGTITIDTDILTQDATAGEETTLTLGTEDDNSTALPTGTYKLAIGGDGDGNDEKDGKVGFELDEPHLYATGGTVKYQYNTGAGWTLITQKMFDDGTKINGTAVTAADVGKIFYTVTTTDDGTEVTAPTVLAQITGFKTDLTATNGAIDGIEVSEDGKTFTITDTKVFDNTTDGTLILSMGTGIADGTYKLALGDDIVKVAHLNEKTPALAVSYSTDPSDTSGTATITGSIEEYATLDSNTQITYNAAATGQPLATISGLKSGANSGISVVDNVITIDSRALADATYSSTTSKTGVIKLSIKDIADNKDFILDLDSTSTNKIDQTANVFNTALGKTVTVANGTATIKQPTYAYYSVSQDGKSVNYNAATSKTIAEITGLSKDAKVDTDTPANSNVTISSDTITLKKAALGKGTMALVNKKVGSTSDHGLKLAFDTTDTNFGTGITTTQAGLQETDVGQGKWVVKSGVATYTLDTAEGWTIDEVNNIITYTPKTTAKLATIKGLKGLTDGTYDYNKLTGVTVSTTSGTTTFSIAKDLLGTAEVTLTDLDAEDSKVFELALGTIADNFTNQDGANKYWVVKDGTVTYQYDVGEGWTVDATTGDIVYTAATTKNVFTVEGLKGIKNGTYKDSTNVDETKAGILKVADLNTAGLTLSSQTISLKNDVLGNNNIKVTTGEGAATGKTYTLALTDYIDTSDGEIAGDKIVGGTTVAAKWFLDSTGTAVYNATKGASWTLNSDSKGIKYTAAETYDKKPLVKITGLKAGITADDLNKYIEVSSTDPKTVTLHKDILGTTEVNFTSSKNTSGTADYTLALGGDVEGVTTTEYWTGKNGTMTLKQDASEGWTVSGNKVTYTAKKTGATLATLSGLDKTLVPSNDSDSDRPAKVEGITVSGTKILIDDAALTTGTVTIKQGKDTKGTATAYSLVYNGTTSSSAAPGANWVVSNGTATLKALKPAYYTSDGTKITYTAPTAEKTKNAQNKDVELVYAKLSGVSKSATPEDFEYVLTNKDGQDVSLAGTTDKTVTGGTVKVKGDAFNRANITLTNGMKDKVTLNFKVAIAESNGTPVVSAPTVIGSAWTLNTAKTVATMKGTISAGYNVSTDKKTIVYSKPQTGATILTISGLPAANVYTSDNNIKVTDSEGKLVEAFQLGYLDSSGAFIEGGTANIVKMSTYLLAKAPTKLTLKGTGYEFAPLTANLYPNAATAYDKANIYTAADTIVAGNDANSDGDFDDAGDTMPGVDVWRVSGTTAVYKRVIPAHFKLTSNNTLVYVKETDAKNSSNKAIVYATISGLAKGLTVSDDGQEVITAKGVTAIDIASGKIDIKEPAISTSVIRYTIGNTKTLVGTTTAVSLNETAGTYLKDNATKDITNAWLISGTTAYYRDTIVSAGWAKAEVQDKNKNVTGYTFTKKTAAAAASGSKVLAQISGLKSGLTANATTGKVDGIEVSSNAITLDNRVLPVSGTPNRTKVTLTNKESSNYTLDIDKSSTNRVAETDTTIENPVWSVSGTNVYYKAGTNATWNLDVDTEGKSKKTLTLTAKSTTETSGFVTISGLAKGLKVDPATGKIPGIDIDDNGVVTISDASVLGKSDVKVTNATIQLASDLKTDGANDISSKTGQKVWSVSGSNAVLKEVTTAGWAEKDTTNNTTNNTTIKYTKETSTVKATITGLKKAALVVKDGKIDGITIGDPNNTKDIDTSTIYLSEGVLDNKTVKITGNTTYKLALAQDVSNKATASIENGGTVWTTSGTTAILKKANTNGYAVKTGGKELTYNNGMTAGSTEVLKITGLKRGIAAKGGKIEGITETPDATTTLTLDSRVLGTTEAKLTLSSDTTANSYKLGLATTANASNNVYAVTDATSGIKYTVDKQGIVTVTDGYTPKGWHLKSDTSITYNSKGADSKNPSTLATISGLKSGIKADANGQIAGITYDSKTFTLSKDVLGTDAVTVTDKDENGTANEYKLAIGSDVTSLASAPSGEWDAKDGAAVYTITSEGGYTVVGDTKVTYTPKGVSKVVVGGLGLTSKPTTGITADLNNKTITVTDAVLTNVQEGDTVTVSEGYTLVLGTAPINSWVVKGTTAYYVQTAGANGYLCDGTTITKGKQGDTQVLATITGLPENFDATNNVTVANGVITLKEDAFTNNTSNIKVTGAGYTLDIDENATSAKEDDATTATWSVINKAATSKVPATSTAILAKGKTSYYKSSADGKTLEYKPFAVTSGTEVATITGLKSGIKASALIVGAENTITLNEDMLGDSSVSLTGAGYKLALASGIPTTLAEAGTEETWTLKGTTLTVKTKPNTYYTKSKDTEISTTVGKTATLATISGLKTDLAINSSGRLDGVTIDDVNKKVKVSAAVLGTGKATLNATGYEFVLDSNVAVPTPTDYKWSISGTTATLKAKVSEGYKLTNTSKEKSIAFVAETNPVVATIEGLKSGLTLDGEEIPGIYFDGETITVSAEALGTTEVKLTNKNIGNFKLALDRDSLNEDVGVYDDNDVEVQTGLDVWKYDAKNFQATYKHVTPAHYELSGDKIKYVAESTGTGIATLTGVGKIEDDMFREDNVVKIFTNDVAGKDISISGGDYTLDLDPQVSKPVVSEATWSKTGNTAVLKGTRAAGYKQNSDTTIEYTTEQKNQIFASIVGATGTFEDSDYVNMEEERVMLYGADLDTEAVTVSGGLLLDFRNYNKATITGSTGADSIAVDGTGLQISLGGGDDYADLGLEGGNTIIYSGGNDVIADFTATGTNQDKLVISSGTVTKAIYSDGDAVLTLSDGKKITLKDFEADSITYFDSKGVANDKTITAADLLESDNFMGANSELGSIVSDTDKLGDLEDTKALTDSNVTTLTKQSSLITYGKK